MRKQHLRRICASLLLGVSLMGLTGCATVTPLSQGDIIHWQAQADPRIPHIYFVLSKNNDLYFREQKGGLFQDTYTDRRLTNTPYVAETNVQVLDPGFVVYLANEPGGGRFYIQPISTDDRDKKEISMQEVLKMSGK